LCPLPLVLSLGTTEKSHSRDSTTFIDKGVCLTGAETHGDTQMEVFYSGDKSLPQRPAAYLGTEQKTDCR